MQKSKLLLSLIVFTSVIACARLEDVSCSSCPSDATGCDILEETSPDTTIIVSTVKCKRGNSNVGEFQSSKPNPSPGTTSKRTYHRSHSFTGTVGTLNVQNPVVDPYFDPSYRERQRLDELVRQRQQNTFTGTLNVQNPVVDPYMDPSYRDRVRMDEFVRQRQKNSQFGVDVNTQQSNGQYYPTLNQVERLRGGNVDPYFDPTYAQRQRHDQMIKSRQQNSNTFSENSRLITNDGSSSLRYVQAGSAHQNGQSATSRCEPCPINAAGCNIREETSKDTQQVITTTTCLDNTNRKMTEVQTTKPNPKPGVFFTRTFYESHRSYQTNNY